MLSDTDWIMHAKATRSMASRSLRHGETDIAQRLFQAASQMETIARDSATASPGANVVKLKPGKEFSRTYSNATRNP